MNRRRKRKGGQRKTRKRRTDVDKNINSRIKFNMTMGEVVFVDVMGSRSVKEVKLERRREREEGRRRKRK